ncbi:hypothetical protein Hanom_Chr16g01463731 [Helianthus anomalus]
METCSACTEKDENIRSINSEFTKIENVFKEKCKEMFEIKKFWKQKEEELRQKCDGLEKENKVLKQKCSVDYNECLQKDNIIQDLHKEYDGMKLSYHTVKEAFETLKSEEKSMERRLSKYIETTRFLEANYENKQRVLSQYIDELAKLKRELSEKEKKVPPPLENNYTFYDDEKVAKSINIVDQLPDNIDVLYSKSDDVDDSDVVGKVVESFLKDDSTKNEKSESHVEDDESFQKKLFEKFKI